MSANKDKEKTVDVPPKGNRNPDPITGAPGSHPVETGVGAALAGAATGFAAGVAAGPVGAVIGAAAGAVAGGYAGKGIGELIDPTTDDTWLRDNFANRPYVKKGESFDTYVPDYQYGGKAESRFQGKVFDEVEADLRSEYEKMPGAKSRTWDQARPAISDAYSRSRQIRNDRTKK